MSDAKNLAKLRKRRAAWARSEASDATRRLQVLTDALRALSAFAYDLAERHGQDCGCDFCMYRKRESVETIMRDVGGAGYNCLMSAEIIPGYTDIDLVPVVRKYLERLVAGKTKNADAASPALAAGQGR